MTAWLYSLGHLAASPGVWLILALAAACLTVAVTVARCSADTRRRVDRGPSLLDRYVWRADEHPKEDQ